MKVLTCRWTLTLRDAVVRKFHLDTTVHVSGFVKNPSLHSREVKTNKSEVNGIHLCYDTVGTGNHLVVLLPGVLGSGQLSFSRQLDNFNKDIFTLIAIDPRGYGRSRPPERQWVKNYLLQDAEDAVKLLQVLGVAKYSLMGWGDGGASAIIAAALYPDRVKRLIVWGVNAEVSKGDRPIYERVQNFESWNEQARKVFLRNYTDSFIRIQLKNWVETNMRYYADQKGGDRCLSYLEYVRCPTLVIHGETDTYIPFHYAEQIRHQIPGARLAVLPNGTHNVHQLNYREFNSTAEQFLIEMEP